MNAACRASVEITRLRRRRLFMILTPAIWLVMPGDAVTILILSLGVWV